MTEHLEREIEAALASRTGRECVFMPSGRFATYVAFRLLLSSGDRVLMSPLEDDTVFIGALVAGLRPVIAPVSTRDGNICTDAVTNATWSSISAVLTSNTYGLPDRVVELKSRCDRLGIPLIEDAAHAIESEVDGRPVGSFGAVSIFSLSKHFPGRGGVLSLGRDISRADVARLQRELMAPKPLSRQVVEKCSISGQGFPGCPPPDTRGAACPTLDAPRRVCRVAGPSERPNSSLLLPHATLASSTNGCRRRTLTTACDNDQAA